MGRVGIIIDPVTPTKGAKSEEELQVGQLQDKVEGGIILVKQHHNFMLNQPWQFKQLNQLLLNQPGEVKQLNPLQHN